MSHDDGDRAFVHIKVFERAGGRPAFGDLVAFAVSRERAAGDTAGSP